MILRKTILLIALLIVGCEKDTPTAPAPVNICGIKQYSDGTWMMYNCYEDYGEASCIAKADGHSQYHFDYWGDNVTCEEYCEENSGSGAFGGCWINPNP